MMFDYDLHHPRLTQPTKHKKHLVYPPTVMKKPTGIEVYTEEVPGDGYDVTVAWAKPEHPPLKYNVSVRSNNTYYVTVDGVSPPIFYVSALLFQEFEGHFQVVNRLSCNSAD